MGRRKDLSVSPFTYSYKTFMKLSGEEMQKVFDDAGKKNSDFVKKYFKAHPDKDWIVIAKKPKNVAAAGKSGDEPYEDDLLELAKKYDGPVFTYSRTKIIEEAGIKCLFC